MEDITTILVSLCMTYESLKEDDNCGDLQKPSKTCLKLQILLETGELCGLAKLVKLGYTQPALQYINGDLGPT